MIFIDDCTALFLYYKVFAFSQCNTIKTHTKNQDPFPPLHDPYPLCPRLPDIRFVL